MGFALDPKLEMDTETLVLHLGQKFMGFVAHFHKKFWFWYKTGILPEKVYAAIWPISEISSLNLAFLVSSSCFDYLLILLSWSHYLWSRLQKITLKWVWREPSELCQSSDEGCDSNFRIGISLSRWLHFHSTFLPGVQYSYFQNYRCRTVKHWHPKWKKYNNSKHATICFGNTYYLSKLFTLLFLPIFIPLCDDWV